MCVRVCVCVCHIDSYCACVCAFVAVECVCDYADVYAHDNNCARNCVVLTWPSQISSALLECSLFGRVAWPSLHPVIRNGIFIEFCLEI